MGRKLSTFAKIGLRRDKPAKAGPASLTTSENSFIKLFSLDAAASGFHWRGAFTRLTFCRVRTFMPLCGARLTLSLRRGPLGKGTPSRYRDAARVSMGQTYRKSTG